MRKMPDETQRNIAQEKGVNHGQMIGAYNPGSPVSVKLRGALPSEFPQIADAVIHQANHQKIEGCNKNKAQPAQNILHLQPKSGSGIHIILPEFLFYDLHGIADGTDLIRLVIFNGNAENVFTLDDHINQARRVDF
jgi:hypothetical protein